MSGDLVVMWTAVALTAAWFVTSVLPMSYWRAANVERRILYRWRWGYWCDHVQDHADDSWTEWTTGPRQCEWRWCRRCGVEQRRLVPGAWV